MVESRRHPCDRGVALLASRGKSAHHVIRIGRVLEVFLVARNTGRARQVVVIVDVAVHTGSRRVRVPPGQGESHRIVVKLGIQPVIRRVALIARRPESKSDMVRVERILKVRLVARIAHRGHGLELTIGGVLVAGIAIHCGVRPGQRETVIVLLNFLDRYSPSPHRVALLAIRAQLPLMYVGVTVLTALAHIAEHRLHMALGAGDM